MMTKRKSQESLGDIQLEQASKDLGAKSTGGGLIKSSTPDAQGKRGESSRGGVISGAD